MYQRVDLIASNCQILVSNLHLLFYCKKNALKYTVKGLFAPGKKTKSKE